MRRRLMHKPVTNRRVIQLILISIACLAAMPCAEAQEFDFPSAAVEDPGALSRVIPGLAREVIAA
jgi:hypothetical protein